MIIFSCEPILSTRHKSNFKKSKKKTILSTLTDVKSCFCFDPTARISDPLVTDKDFMSDHKVYFKYEKF